MSSLDRLRVKEKRARHISAAIGLAVISSVFLAVTRGDDPVGVLPVMAPLVALAIAMMVRSVHLRREIQRAGGEV